MSTQKLSSRKAQAIKTRKKIYDVSIKLIRKNGFEGATIEDISKKAGVSVGTFYHYFSSKSEILNEIYHQLDDYFENVVAAKIAGGPLADRILSFFDHYASFNLENGLDFVKQIYNTQNKLFIKSDRYTIQLLSQIIAEGQTNKELKSDLTSIEITNDLFILARGIIFDWCLHEGDYNLQAAIASQMQRYLSTFLMS